MAVRATAYVGGLLRRPSDVTVEERPRYRWPEKDWVDVMVGKLSRHGTIEFADPFVGDASYRIDHEADGCPNVRLMWKRSPLTIWEGVCVRCDGYWCESYHDVYGGARWGLAYALIAAIYAGRRVEQLCDGRACSTAGDNDRMVEVPNYGEGSAREEARTGLSPEPEAPRAEAVRPDVIYTADTTDLSVWNFASISRAIAETATSIGILAEDLRSRAVSPVPPVGSIIVQDSGFNDYFVQLVDGSGVLLREMSYERAWALLWDGGGLHADR